MHNLVRDKQPFLKENSPTDMDISKAESSSKSSHHHSSSRSRHHHSSSRSRHHHHRHHSSSRSNRTYK